MASYYEQLNSLSSAVLFDTSKPKKGKLYEVERIIYRRRTKHDYEYLLKWKGWGLEYCSWEPTDNLTVELLRCYNCPPKPLEGRLINAGRDFFSGINSYLRGNTLAPIYINMELDVWRFLMNNVGTDSSHKGHKMYEMDDFQKFSSLTLPHHWYYALNEHGEGTAIDFLVKAKAVLSWIASHHIIINGELTMAPKYPIEKLCLRIPKKPCNVDTL